MPEQTTQHTEKLVRDLEVGDVIHREDFDLNGEVSHVTVKELNPYGTSFHSLIVSGEYLWEGDDGPSRESYVFDKLTVVRTVNP
tara:strand:- start:238 stop:489 length:252 start_codon:yes stop_codon:yes gene_type:complete